MTLPETMDKENVSESRRLKLKAMSHTLRACLKQALRRNGLTCGMKACGELLNSNPSTVMVCLLPGDCQDISVHIHQTLIHAFCRENNILVIQMKDDTKLAALLYKLSEGNSVRKGRVNGKMDDTSCLLMQFPKRGPSKDDQLLFQYFEELSKQCYPMPHLSLPD
ncbi:unnamed protein product [Lymnaea stagnalis]|uniref:Ribosomal protein eL8/eL30/eS12/Gadd45 domain-containing protein n=1 Tax=Lymnaea stagnalis TaxID=6523 RepID=A0AAV2IH99_LYMST